MKELHAFLLETGFTAYPQRGDDPAFCSKVLFQRRLSLDATGEQASSRPLNLNVTTWVYSGRSPAVEMCEVDVTGEMPDGSWAKFLAYSLEPTELPQRLASVEARLTAAWLAAASAESGV